uniref:NBS-containing resistance-like protein n=1 Tax=Tanacetum cinerariifolium TaxID=118510 RepID=A0A6L2JHC7_TANCI|nr:NBS-containing resistance-like protein [Tanacetum cinerariifolium]
MLEQFEKFIAYSSLSMPTGLDRGLSSSSDLTLSKWILDSGATHHTRSWLGNLLHCIRLTDSISAFLIFSARRLSGLPPFQYQRSQNEKANRSNLVGIVPALASSQSALFPYLTLLLFSIIPMTSTLSRGCPATRRSTSRYCVFLGDNLLTWSSKRQYTLSRSSAEAEYRGAANAVAETSWIRNLLREHHTLLFTATLVYCDNVSAVYMSANPVQHQRTKHIEIDIHFVHDKVAAGHVRVLHVASRFQYSDIFTKELIYPLFANFRSSLSVCISSASTTGAY